MDETMAVDSASVAPVEEVGFHKALKTKFIEGNAGFMSLVALALVLGLAFCIERIIYLSLSEINAKKFMKDLDAKIMSGDVEGAKAQCRDTRGPVASICYQGLERIGESMDNVERSIVSYGSVQSANLERGCSWITLFIAMAPSLGFLGTVIGMVMAFDQIQTARTLKPAASKTSRKMAAAAESLFRRGWRLPWGSCFSFAILLTSMSCSFPVQQAPRRRRRQPPSMCSLPADLRL